MKPLGKCSYDKKRLYINESLKDYGQWCVTFWHEWLHGTFYENGYESQADNEALVEATAQAIMRMFSDPQGRILVADMLHELEPK
jgi:hypothetical protein